MVLALPAGAAQFSVPFVGCPADGQQGPQAAPKGAPYRVDLAPAAAARLAFYGTQEIGVLGPRGWHCAVLYGSSGSLLFVSPRPMKPADFLSAQSKKVGGPFIQVGFSFGGTSGRSEVAAMIARYFPYRADFLRTVVELEKSFGMSPSYPAGAFPKDKKVARQKNIVEYVTPPFTEGLGTHSRLKPDAEPIYAAAMLDSDEEPNVLTVAVRLPQPDAGLAWTIIRDLERLYRQGK